VAVVVLCHRVVLFLQVEEGAQEVVELEEIVVLLELLELQELQTEAVAEVVVALVTQSTLLAVQVVQEL
jgi:hypothetical protein